MSKYIIDFRMTSTYYAVIDTENFGIENSPDAAMEFVESPQFDGPSHAHNWLDTDHHSIEAIGWERDDE